MIWLPVCQEIRQMSNHFNVEQYKQLKAHKCEVCMKMDTIIDAANRKSVFSMTEQQVSIE